MAVTNLTGYTWVANEYLEMSELMSIGADINFTSNETNYIKFYRHNNSLNPYDEVTLEYHSTLDPWDSTLVYDLYSEGGWLNINYRTVLFTGGAEVENLELIGWLDANGTLTPPPSPSIADKLLAVNQIKQDIKSAIEDKDIDMTDVEFSGYAEKIDELSSVVELTQAQYDALPFCLEGHMEYSDRSFRCWYC